MPKLIWVFAGRTAILLVFSCRGSYCYDNVYDVCRICLPVNVWTELRKIPWLLHMRLIQLLLLVSITRCRWNDKRHFKLDFLTLLVTNSDVLSLMRSKYSISSIRDHINLDRFVFAEIEKELFAGKLRNCRCCKYCFLYRSAHVFVFLFSFYY